MAVGFPKNMTGPAMDCLPLAFGGFEQRRIKATDPVNPVAIFQQTTCRPNGVMRTARCAEVRFVELIS